MTIHPILFGNAVSDIFKSLLQKPSTQMEKFLDLLTSNFLSSGDATIVDQSWDDIYYQHVIYPLVLLQTNLQDPSSSVGELLGVTFMSRPGKGFVIGAGPQLRVMLVGMDGITLYDSFSRLPGTETYREPGVNSLYNSSFVDKNGLGGRQLITVIQDSSNNSTPENQNSRFCFMKSGGSVSGFQTEWRYAPAYQSPEFCVTIPLVKSNWNYAGQLAILVYGIPGM